MIGACRVMMACVLVALCASQASAQDRKLPDYKGLEDLLGKCNALLGSGGAPAVTPKTPRPVVKKDPDPKPATGKPDWRFDPRAIQLAEKLVWDEIDDAGVTERVAELKEKACPQVMVGLHALLVGEHGGAKRRAALELLKHFVPELKLEIKGRLKAFSPEHKRYRAWIVDQYKKHKPLSAVYLQRTRAVKKQLMVLEGARDKPTAEKAAGVLIKLGEEHCSQGLLRILERRMTKVGRGRRGQTSFVAEQVGRVLKHYVGLDSRSLFDSARKGGGGGWEKRYVEGIAKAEADVIRSMRACPYNRRLILR